MWIAGTRALLGPALAVRRRATRQEFWIVALTGLLVSFVGAGATTRFADPEGLVPFVYLAIGLIPVACAGVRRLHDLDRTGWWALLGALPVLGLPIQFLIGFRPGRPSPSRYGPVPESPDWDGINAVGISYIVDLLVLWLVVAGVHALATL